MKLESIRVSIAFALAFIGASCDQIARFQAEKNECPGKLVGASENPGIQWRGGDVSANIASVLVECIPHHNPATEKTAAFTEYKIPVTARITYKLGQYELGTFEDSIIFEAVTANGVVLNSVKTSFRLIRGNTTSTASAILAGLSPEDIIKLTRVTARWEYGN